MVVMVLSVGAGYYPFSRLAGVSFAERESIRRGKYWQPGSVTHIPWVDGDNCTCNVMLGIKACVSGIGKSLNPSRDV